MADETEEFPADLPVDQPAEETPPADPAPEPAPEPEPDPRDARVAELSQRLRDQEALNQRLYERALQQQPAYAPEQHNRDPFADAPSPEWQESLRTTHRYIAPAMAQQFEPRFQQMQQQLEHTEATNERLLLRQAAMRDQRYADYEAYEPQVLQAQAALKQQGVKLPLEAIYFYVKGAQGAPQSQVQQAEQRGAQRARVASNARVETGTPTGTAVAQRPGMPTLEQIKSWPTSKIDELGKLIEQHPEWL